MDKNYTKEFTFEDGKTVEVYNSSDKLVESSSYDKSGDLTMKVAYQYDDKGNNTNRVILNKDGKQIRALKFEYDDNGRLIKDEEFNSDNQFVYLRTFEYGREDKKIKVKVFGKNGNLIEEKLQDFI